MMAYLRNKQEAQGIRENLSDAAVQSRESQRQALIAQNQLAQATAESQQNLVQPTAQLAAQDIAVKQLQAQKASAEVWDKNAVDMYKEYNPTLYKEDGVTPDNEGMAEAGRSYLRARDALTYAQQGMAATPSKELDPDTNQPIVVMRNANGEDVTPREDNPAYTHYRDLRQKAIELLFSPAKPHTSRGAGTGADPTDVPDAEPAPMVTGTATPDNIVTPLTQTPHPSIGVPVYQSGMGRAVGAVPGTTLPETLATVRQFPEYESWAAKQEAMNNFVDAANAINEPITTADKTIAGPIMNQKDFALIQAVKQLATPTVSAASGRTLPDLQSHALEENMPALELLGDWKQVLSRQGTLSEGTRKRLIELGKTYVASKERSALPRINWATENTKRPAADIFGTTSPEAALHTGKSILNRLNAVSEGAAAGATGLPADAAGPVKNIGGMNVYLGKDGKFHKL